MTISSLSHYLFTKRYLIIVSSEVKMLSWELVSMQPLFGIICLIAEHQIQWVQHVLHIHKLVFDDQPFAVSILKRAYRANFFPQLSNRINHLRSWLWRCCQFCHVDNPHPMVSLYHFHLLYQESFHPHHFMKRPSLLERSTSIKGAEPHSLDCSKVLAFSSLQTFATSQRNANTTIGIHRITQKLCWVNWFTGFPFLSDSIVSGRSCDV